MVSVAKMADTTTHLTLAVLRIIATETLDAVDTVAVDLTGTTAAHTVRTTSRGKGARAHELLKRVRISSESSPFFNPLKSFPFYSISYKLLKILGFSLIFPELQPVCMRCSPLSAKNSERMDRHLY